MGLESMRGSYGRCPPLLVGGLIVVSLILTCNWWSLSSQNYELLKQMDEMGEQLKRCVDERDQSNQLRLSVEGRLKSSEEELAQLRVRLEQQEINSEDIKKQLEEKDNEVKNVNKEMEGSKNSITMCKTELESLKKVSLSKDGMIDSLKIEKEGLKNQREESKKDFAKLKAELNKVMSELDNVKASQVAAGAVAIGNKNTAAGWRNKNRQEQLSSIKVEHHDRGMHGMRYHGVPIILSDPPNAYRPPPRFSVAHPLISAGKAAETAPKVVVAKPSDLNADEKDEDNAKERGDGDGNLNEAVAVEADDERFDKNNDENDANNIPEEAAQEDSVDQMAHAIQEDNEGAVAAPPPGKSSSP